MRYEQFERPNKVCRELFRFIFDSNTSTEYNSTMTKVSIITLSVPCLTVSQVCNVYFPNSIKPPASFSTSSGSASRSSDSRVSVLLPRNRAVNLKRKPNSRKLEVDILDDPFNDFVDSRRSLRLRNYQDTKSFQFIPELVTSTGKERIKEYRAALEKLPAEIRSELIAVDIRLRRFGYSLTEWAVSEARNNLLSPWEIQT